MNVALKPPTHDPAIHDIVYTPETRFEAARRDIVDAWQLRRLCSALAWLDIKLRYRGSILGPLWLTLSTAVMAAAMGTLYAGLFKIKLQDYLPFLVLSLVLWNYLATLVADGSVVYTISESMIRSVRMPLTLYAARVVVRNVLVLAHTFVVVVIVFAIFGKWPGAAGLLALPGFVLWLVDSLALSVLLGSLCARFRDIPPIVASVLQIAFFVTPVIWRPELIGPARRWILPVNPFFSILEMVRAPLLGEMPQWIDVVSAVSYSMLLCLGAWFLFVRVRGRIAFWL